MFAPWDLGPTIRITAFTLTALSTVVVAVRFYCRIWIVGKLKLYDHVMTSSLILTWGLCVINYYQTMTGSGQRLPKDWKPPPPTPEYMAALTKMLRDGAISWFAYRITYVVTLGLIKMSILIFYLSFATSRSFKNIVIVTMVVVILFTVVTGFLNGFECPHNPSMTLDERIFNEDLAAKCLKRPILYYSQAGFNIFSDLWILILPMPALLQLRMPTLKRCSLIAVFSVGFIVPIASALRTWALVLWATSTDGRYKGGYMLFWSQVEINTAIVCASMPSWQPIFKRIFGRLITYGSHSAYYYYAEGENTMDRNANPGRITSYTCTIEAPSSSYQPKNKRDTAESGNELVLIKEADEEEQIRDRIRHFASHSSLTDHHSPRAPERPKEILSYG